MAITYRRVRQIEMLLIALFVVLQGLLGKVLINPLWILGNFIIVVIYFDFLLNSVNKTHGMHEKKFRLQLFRYSLIVRLVTVFVLTIVAEITWNRASYVGAVDAVRYLRVAGEVSDVFWEKGFSYIPKHLWYEYGVPDGYGIPYVIGLLFAFTVKSAIIAKFFIAFIGSLSVLLIYRTALFFVDSATARLAGLLAAFMPLSLFYDAVILKESFVVFFTSLSIYLSSKMVMTGKFHLYSIVELALTITALFFFRIAAGAVIVACLFVFCLVNRVKGRSAVRAWIAGMVVMVFVLVTINATGFLGFFIKNLESGTKHGENRISAIEQRTTWKNLSLGPIYLVISHFAPFPSMINTGGWTHIWGHDATYYWISGLIVWNILSIFALLGIWEMMHTMLTKAFMIWGYTVGYSIVLGITAMFTQVRLGWNVMPMMMIPVAIGLRNYKKARYFYLALSIACLLMIAWNVFRAKGRGLL